MYMYYIQVISVLDSNSMHNVNDLQVISRALPIRQVHVQVVVVTGLIGVLSCITVLLGPPKLNSVKVGMGLTYMCGQVLSQT